MRAPNRFPQSRHCGHCWQASPRAASEHHRPRCNSAHHGLVTLGGCRREAITAWFGNEAAAHQRHFIKLLNNFVAQAICNATAEAFAVGQKAGVDLKQFVSLVSAGLANSGLFQVLAKTLDGQLDGLKFELNNARKDVRYDTHLAENLGVPSVMGEAEHQSLVVACALGYGSKLVLSLVEAQEQLAGVKIVPR